MNPWGTPPVTGCQTEYKTSITTLWVLPVIQFPTHLADHPSSLYLASLSRRRLWETLLNTLLKLSITSAQSRSVQTPSKRRECCYTFLQFFCNLSQTIARSSSLPCLRSSASFLFSVLIHMVLFSFLLRLFLFSSNKNINWISNQHCILGSSRSKNKNWGLLWHKWIHCDGATHSYFSNPLTCFRIRWLTYLVLSIHYVSDL